MMSQPEEAKPDSLKFSDIVYKFLDNLQHNSSAGTLKWYQERLSLFVDDFGPIPATSTKPFEVLSSVNKHKNWSANSRHKSLLEIKTPLKSTKDGSVSIFG
jgi:hypothetical protein